MTTINRKKSITAALGAAAAALAAPAMLFLGTGTAHAAGDIHVSWNPQPSSLGVNVVNWSNDHVKCTYTSRATLMPLIPVYHKEFKMLPWGNASWHIPVDQTGVTWDTFVSCSNGAVFNHTGAW